MAQLSRFRYVRRRAAHSDGIQFVLLSEKSALVRTARAAAGGLDGLPHTPVFDRLGILGIVWMLAVLVLLAFNPQRFQDNLVWLLPPLALFGAAQLDNLRRGAAAFVNWFGIMAFGLFAVFLWTGFSP